MYASFLYFGSIENASAQPQTITVRNVLTKPGEHHLSGTLLVQSSCHNVSLRTEEISENNFRLVFSTWQEPSRNCTKTPEPRTFSTVVFAPTYGTFFSATLDGQSVPLQIEKKQ